jgi:nitrile hydratase
LIVLGLANLPQEGLAMHISPTKVPAASIENRVSAVEHILERTGIAVKEEVAHLTQLAQEHWIPENGARLVARSWVDPSFRKRLLQNAMAAAAELGLSMPAHHRHLVVLENSATIHNVICCTLCSCTAFTIIGLPPDWYKDFEYRSRIVRQARSVLAEMGLELDPAVEIRVWDTTADTRYMVLPERPPGTEGWSEACLAAVVTKESMIGVQRLESMIGVKRLESMIGVQRLEA